MELILYTNNSANDVMGKSLTGLHVYNNVIVKNEHNLNNLDVTVTNDYNANYCKLGSKYYFINNKTNLMNGNIRLSLSVDVLETYKTQLKAKNFRIIRSSNIYNRYIVDNDQVISGRDQLQTLKLNGGSLGDFSTSTQCYVLTVNNTSILE